MQVREGWEGNPQEVERTGRTAPASSEAAGSREGTGGGSRGRRGQGKEEEGARSALVQRTRRVCHRTSLLSG